MQEKFFNDLDGNQQHQVCVLFLNHWAVPKAHLLRALTVLNCCIKIQGHPEGFELTHSAYMLLNGYLMASLYGDGIITQEQVNKRYATIMDFYTKYQYQILNG